MIPTDGPPQLSFNWIDNPQLNVHDGRRHPAAPGEFTMDFAAADKHGFGIGDTYELVTPNGQTHLRLSGTTSFGADNSTLGAT